MSAFDLKISPSVHADSSLPPSELMRTVLHDSLDTHPRYRKSNEDLLAKEYHAMISKTHS